METFSCVKSLFHYVNSHMDIHIILEIIYELGMYETVALLILISSSPRCVLQLQLDSVADSKTDNKQTDRDG